MRSLVLIAVMYLSIAYTASANTTINKKSDEDVSLFVQDFVQFNKSATKTELLLKLLQSNLWVDYSIFDKEIESLVNFNTSPQIKQKILSKIKNPTDRQKLLLWDAASKNKSSNMMPSFWMTAELTPAEEKMLIMKYRNLLNEKIILKRMHQLYWNKELNNIEILKRLISNKARKDFISSGLKPPKINNKPLKAEYYESYKYINNLIKKEKYSIASKLVLKLDYTGANNKQIDKWWNIKHILSRENLKLKRYFTAYALSSKHMSQTPGIVSDGEWLSGWIMLRFLKKPEIASNHFLKLHKCAKLSDTKAKAAYWLWRSYRANKKNEEANKWINTAALYPGFFYGQVAHLTLGTSPNYFAKQVTAANNMGYWKARKQILSAVILNELGYRSMAYKLIDKAATNKLSAVNAQKLIHTLAKAKDNELIVIFSKKMANYNNINLPQGFPTKLNIKGVDAPLYYAIIRQESNFHPKAASIAGAYGLMQLMPATAKLVSQKLNLPSHGYKTNPGHNVRIGCKYISDLKTDFNSYILAIAAYNAGEKHAVRWLNTNGPINKRSMISIIDWIESISFGETRFYVKKVLANTLIYNNILPLPNKNKPRSYLS